MGLWFLVDTGIADLVLPELPAMRVEQDPIHRHKDVLAHTIAVVAKTRPDLRVRMAALLHDVGKPRTRSIGPKGVSFHHHEVVGARMARDRLRALRFTNEQVEAIGQLVYLHLRFHGYGDDAWTDAAVRRYVRDAGPLLDDLNELTRCDCTTRNERKARQLAERMDALEARIADLREQEELEAIRPDLDGQAVMAHLGLAPGRQVGEALEMLLEARLEEGPLDDEEAYRRLDAWWAEQGAPGERSADSATAVGGHRTAAGARRRRAMAKLGAELAGPDDEGGGEELHRGGPARAAGPAGGRLGLEDGVDPEVGPAEAREQLADRAGHVGRPARLVGGDRGGVPVGPPDAPLGVLGVDDARRRGGGARSRTPSPGRRIRWTWRNTRSTSSTDASPKAETAPSIVSARRKASSASGAWCSSTRTPSRSQAARASATWSDDSSTPMTLAPWRASAIALWPTPQPRSRIRLPSTEPSSLTTSSRGTSAP